jgi:Ca2+-binding EF-hand superfamily protein
VDINGDNQITYTEFLAATMDPLELDVGAVSRAFQLMDVNNDGYITAEELKKVLSVKFEGVHHKVQPRRQRGKNRKNASSDEQKANNDEDVEVVAAPPRDGGPFFSRKSLSMSSMLKKTASSAGKALLLSSSNAKSMLNLLGSSRKNGDGPPRSKKDDDDEQDDDGDEEVDERVISLEERIRDLMLTCDVDNDGVISYAEFLWAMTGAKDIVGDMSTFGPQTGDLPRNFHPVSRISSVAEGAGDNNSKLVGVGSKSLSLPDAVTMDTLLIHENNMMLSSSKRGDNGKDKSGSDVSSNNGASGAGSNRLIATTGGWISAGNANSKFPRQCT